DAKRIDHPPQKRHLDAAAGVFSATRRAARSCIGPITRHEPRSLSRRKRFCDLCAKTCAAVVKLSGVKLAAWSKGLPRGSRALATSGLSFTTNGAGRHS